MMVNSSSELAKGSKIPTGPLLLLPANAWSYHHSIYITRHTVSPRPYPSDALSVSGRGGTRTRLARGPRRARGLLGARPARRGSGRARSDRPGPGPSGRRGRDGATRAGVSLIGFPRRQQRGQEGQALANALRERFGEVGPNI